jgi:hypothetical protein
MPSIFFLFENRAVYEIISRNMVEPERPQMTIWQHVSRWISKTTLAQAHTLALAPIRANTQKYVILIAFPL